MNPSRKMLVMRNEGISADSEVANIRYAFCYSKGLATKLFRQEGQVLCEIDLPEGTHF